MPATAEHRRLEECRNGNVPWKKWGPYLSERQWGTVREDYSPTGDAWEYFPYEMALRRAYRWGEDGIAGICDEDQILCFSLALWNGRDPHLKERLFGLTGKEGNHGEDVKELYYYLDSTPTHSYMKMLYKYPQGLFPYEMLRSQNALRTREEPEFEILDTGIFAGGRYFDVTVETAKASAEDLLIRVTIENRSPDDATLHLLPHLFFRNTWSWGRDPYKPALRRRADGAVDVDHRLITNRSFYGEGSPEALFCDNDTNAAALFDCAGQQGFFKDGINEFVVNGTARAVNPLLTGTKSAFHYHLTIPAGGSRTVRCRLSDAGEPHPFADFDRLVEERHKEADEFYAELQAGINDPELRTLQRVALSGMLHSKQFYYYDVPQWLAGDPSQPVPPAQRLHGRNSSWLHLNNANVISMPDKWEYPWYAAWDLAFHCLALAKVDVDFAKEQLVLLTREWFMHPNGQLPAYEWALSDVNPPLHAWAAWRVYQIDRRARGGKGDTEFLERVFLKMLLNFTWWVNRKDSENRNIFQGGFLGLDNIGVFDRSAPLPNGESIEQADATSWMAMFALTMMRCALELALERSIYQDLATKFFEHFLYIAGAMANIAGEGINLWDEEDEFFYDVLHDPSGANHPLKVRSMVGLIPLFAVETLEPELLNRLPEFKEHVEWFLNYRPDLAALISRWEVPGVGERRLLSLLRGHRMKRLLRRMLDPREFLSPYGVRALSRYHLDHPYALRLDSHSFSVSYEPAEATTGLFGGNSNWRGPVWFPLNYLIIESLERFHHYYGDAFRIECPTGSGMSVSLKGVAALLTERLTNIFLRDEKGNRPLFGVQELLQSDPHFRDLFLFYEYFHGESGAGLGASHQTGWTGLLARLIDPPREAPSSSAP